MTRVLRFGLLALLAGSAAKARGDLPKGHTLDKTKLYPLLVPADYFRDSASKPVRRPLVKGIDVALAIESGSPVRGAGGEAEFGLVEYATGEDLRLAGLEVDSAYRLALENLEHAAEKGIVQPRLATGADAIGKLVILSGHWLSATCNLLRGLPKIASQALGSDKIIAVVPHRNSLVLFADSPDRKKWVRWVLEREEEGQKPLTKRPLHLRGTATAEFWRQPPVVFAD
jgi:hypothetical protein